LYTAKLPPGKFLQSERPGIRRHPAAEGLSAGPIDLLIAGTALSRDAMLATDNLKEFSRLKGLRLSDWTEPAAAIDSD